MMLVKGGRQPGHGSRLSDSSSDCVKQESSTLISATAEPLEHSVPLKRRAGPGLVWSELSVIT